MSVTHYFTDEVTVEPFLGSGAYGPQFGDAETVSCRVQAGRKLVRDATGAEVVSEVTIYARLTENITVESRITIDGKQSTVVAVKKHRGSPRIAHLEVNVA